MTDVKGFRHELPDGSISTEEYSSEYAAYYAGCRQTWNEDAWKTWQVKVVNPKGDRVPTYMFCDDCNYDRHQCPGCGWTVLHEGPGVCDGCREQLDEGVPA